MSSGIGNLEILSGFMTENSVMSDIALSSEVGADAVGKSALDSGEGA